MIEQTLPTSDGFKCFLVLAFILMAVLLTYIIIKDRNGKDY